MLRIYARVLAAALVVIAVAAAAVRIPNEGLGLSVLYAGSAAVFAYAGFRRGDAAVVRSVVTVMGSVLLVSGLVALAMGVLGFPFGGRGWEVGLAHVPPAEITAPARTKSTTNADETTLPTASALSTRLAAERSANPLSSVPR
jgi:hypothetical protein